MNGDAVSEHIAARPSWDCVVCGQTWPCANAKTSLAIEFAGNAAALCVYLAGCFQDALRDLTARGEPTPADLYDRFLGWVGPPSPPP